MASQPQTQGRLAELGFWANEANRIARCLDGVVARVGQLTSHDVKQLVGPRKDAIAMLERLRREVVPQGVDARGFSNALAGLQSAVDDAPALLFPNPVSTEVM